MFLYTIELLVKVDEKLGGEISIDYWRSMHNTSSSNNNGIIADNMIECNNQDGKQIIENNSNNNSNSNSENNNKNSDHHSYNNNRNTFTTGLINNDKHQNSSIIAECPIPSTVRQRRRLRRFRQELEASTVWCKRDQSTSSLTNQGQYALRLLSTQAALTGSVIRNNDGSSSSSSSGVGGDDRMRRLPGTGAGTGTSDGQSAVISIVNDILKYSQVTAVHVDRLYSICSGYVRTCSCPVGLHTCSPLFSSFPSSEPLTHHRIPSTLFFVLCFLQLFTLRAGDTRHRASSSSSSNPSQDPTPSPTPALALVGILRHPSLLDLLIIAFVHPSKQLPSPTHIHTAKLLALICGSYYEENPELGIISSFPFSSTFSLSF